MEILLGMGNKPRFGGSGKIGWARLTEKPVFLSIGLVISYETIIIIRTKATFG
jgi:hypothetical protein